MMQKLTRLPVILLALLASGPLHAACFADYRAKMDDPLRLHYGVIDLPDALCDLQMATPEITARLAVAGWDLLQVISVFREDGLAERREDAGDYYLAF
jgi:hypothetical protein